MNFAYQGVDLSGGSVSGTVSAQSESEAREILRRENIFALTLTAEAGTAGSPPTARRRLGSTRRTRNLAVFTRQLQVLLAAGTPLVQALLALERQSRDPRWRRLVADLRQRIEDGDSLSAAMAAHPDCFDVVTRALVQAGEAGGQLEPMLDRVAALARKQAHVRSAILGAMIYPALLIFVAVGVLLVLLTFVLPRFAGLFETLDTPLPPTTQMLMAVSDLLRGYWWGLLPALGVLGAVAVAWSRTASARRLLDGLVLTLPVFGPIVRSFATARIARLLGVQAESKVPLLDALKLTRQATTNSRYAQLLADAEDAATRGQSISVPFAASPLIGPAICEAIRNGEQTGQVGSLLLGIADYLDEENELVIRSLTSILEPMILIALGLLVGFIAVSMFLPLFDLTAMTSGGSG